jgi:DNA replication protein DnaC
LAGGAVSFELISARYERRSLLITANQPFGSWDEIFPDKAMTSPPSTASCTTPSSWK